MRDSVVIGACELCEGVVRATVSPFARESPVALYALPHRALALLHSRLFARWLSKALRAPPRRGRGRARVSW